MRLSPGAAVTILVILAGGVNVIRDVVLLTLVPFGIHMVIEPALGTWHP